MNRRDDNRENRFRENSRENQEIEKNSTSRTNHSRDNDRRNGDRVYNERQGSFGDDRKRSREDDFSDRSRENRDSRESVNVGRNVNNNRNFGEKSNLDERKSSREDVNRSRNGRDSSDRRSTDRRSRERSSFGGRECSFKEIRDNSPKKVEKVDTSKKSKFIEPVRNPENAPPPPSWLSTEPTKSGTEPENPDKTRNLKRKAAECTKLPPPNMPPKNTPSSISPRKPTQVTVSSPKIGSQEMPPPNFSANDMKPPNMPPPNFPSTDMKPPCWTNLDQESNSSDSPTPDKKAKKEPWFASSKNKDTNKSPVNGLSTRAGRAENLGFTDDKKKETILERIRAQTAQNKLKMNQNKPVQSTPLSDDNVAIEPVLTYAAQQKEYVEKLALHSTIKRSFSNISSTFFDKPVRNPKTKEDYLYGAFIEALEMEGPKGRSHVLLEFLNLDVENRTADFIFNEHRFNTKVQCVQNHASNYLNLVIFGDFQDNCRLFGQF